MNWVVGPILPIGSVLYEPTGFQISEGAISYCLNSGGLLGTVPQNQPIKEMNR